MLNECFVRISVRYWDLDGRLFGLSWQLNLSYLKFHSYLVQKIDLIAVKVFVNKNKTIPRLKMTIFFLVTQQTNRIFLFFFSLTF